MRFKEISRLFLRFGAESNIGTSILSRRKRKKRPKEFEDPSDKPETQVFSRWRLLALALVIASFFCLKITDGFSILAIASDRHHDLQWDIPSPLETEKQEIENALSQPYIYYGCGGQSYIFFSHDGQYVLKFFKQCRYRKPLWHDYVPIPFVLDRYKAKKRWKRENKQRRDFFSYAIAFKEWKEESGLLLVHLNKTTYLQKQLTLVDRLQIHHTIDLDHFDFVLQKRAVLAYDAIRCLMQRGDEEKAKAAIAKLLRLIVQRCEKGLHDRDPNISTNCGFIAETAIGIDVGSLVRCEEIRSNAVYKKEVMRTFLPFLNWLEASYPQLATYLNQELAPYASS